MSRTIAHDQATAPVRRPGRLAAAAAALGLAALVAAGCSSAGDNGEGAGPVEVGVGATDVTIAPEGDPVYGGTLIYGLEAETNGYNPIVDRWAVAGHMVGMTVFDPLAAYDADGTVQPYLASSIEPNDDFTEWTVTLRDGVTFHDGTPATAADVVATIEAHKASGLTGTALTPVDTVEQDGELTAVITMNQPWVAFPAAMTAQVGYLLSPTMLGDDTRDAASRAPVGTGPFQFVEWQANQRFVAEKYDDYWRDGLPYLDRVEFRTSLTDVNQRVRSLSSGELNIMHTSDPQTIADLRADAAAGEVQLVEDRGEGEESFVLLNLSVEPLNDIRVRRAIAHATDTETFNEVVNGGGAIPANNLFGPDSPWRVDTDYPEFDLDAAQALVDEYLADPDTPSEITFRLTTTPTPGTQQAVQQLAEQWAQVGINADITTVDQASFINTAVLNDFDANLWRQFGAPDPDVDLVWWISGGPATDTGAAANILNFPNLVDDQIDEALTRGRESGDLEERKEAYADFQRRLNELVPYIWLNHTLWAIAANNDVRDFTNGTLPDGQEAYPLGGVGTFGGAHRLTQTWLAG